MGYRSSTLEALHRLTASNRELVEASLLCGCFYCQTTFSPGSISEWVDGDGPDATTALCPHCGVDSVIPQQPDHALSVELLAAMHAYWFERTVSVPSSPRFVQRCRLKLEPILRRIAWNWRRPGKGP